MSVAASNRSQYRAGAAGVSQAHVDTFHQQGFVVWPEFFNPKQMQELARWTDEICSWPEVPGQHMVYYEDSLTMPGTRVLSRIENFCLYHAGFDRLFNSGSVIEALAVLLGEPTVMFKEKINFKLPGGGGFEPHQDVQAGWDAYADLHISMLVSIDCATPDNGCLEIAAGWHDRCLIGDPWKPLGAAVPDAAYKACPTQSGDVVIFDSFVPHRSFPNTTQAARRMLYVTYNRQSAGDHRQRYYADKRASYPPDCEREPGKEYIYRV